MLKKVKKSRFPQLFSPHLRKKLKENKINSRCLQNNYINYCYQWYATCSWDGCHDVFKNSDSKLQS